MDALENQGMLAVWHDVAAGSEALVTDWYNTEHHAERLGVEGFLEARRYRLAGGAGRQFLSLYRTRTPAVLSSPAYLARLGAPSPRTRDIMPRYRNVTRSVFRVARVSGLPQGGCVASLAGTTPPGDWDIEALFAGLQRRTGVLRCVWLLAEAGTSSNGTPEAALRGSADAAVAWAVVIDTNELQDAQAALDAADATLQPSTAAHRAAYRLVYSAGND